MSVEFDEINKWSEVKLDIIEQYAIPYMDIMRAYKFKAHYIDGFSGAGIHVRKNSDDLVPGSPLRVLGIPKPFDTYNFIDLDGDKTGFLEEICVKYFPDRSFVIRSGDCSEVLMEILPQFTRENFDRLFCLLDPYGLHLKWEVIKQMGDMGIVDLIVHFPIMDINRNAIWNNPDKVPHGRVDRMTSFWGDETWRDIAYQESQQQVLFGPLPKEKQTNEIIAEAFRGRLKRVGNFKYVPNPIPLKNSNNAVIYYLFFASQNRVAGEIVSYLFNKVQDTLRYIKMKLTYCFINEKQVYRAFPNFAEEIQGDLAAVLLGYRGLQSCCNHRHQSPWNQSIV